MSNRPTIHGSELQISHPIPVHDKSAHEPDVAQAGDAVWIAWSARGRDGDRICARRLAEDAPILELGTRRGVECQPCLMVQADGSLRVTWVAHRNGTWHLMTRELRGETPGQETSLVTNTDGLFHPRSFVDANGRGWIVFEQVMSQQSCITVISPDDRRASRLRTPNGPCSRPAIAEGPGEGVWVGYDSYLNGHFQVFVQRIDVPSDPLPVTNDGYQNLHPAIAPDRDGNLWIAWASNRNETFRNPWWLTKWIYVCRYDGETFTVPSGAQPGVDVYNEDAWQGWEFPALTADAYGRVWVFGQASHTLYAQFIDHRGWSALHTIAERRWGSWKPRVRVAGSNPLYVAAMGLDGARIQRIEVAPAEGEIQLAEPVAPLQAIVHRRPGKGRPRPGEERPSLVSGENEHLHYYFGDLHAHSTYSDALNDVDEFYYRYRDAYGFDFACLTDHDFLDGIELSHSELRSIWNHADRVTRPGEFVALYGYEWTAPALADHAGEGQTVGEGHRHILYPDQTGPLVSYGEESFNTGKTLLQRLHGVRALVIPHHTPWSGTDWDAHDPELQRLIEVCSIHGRFEYPGNKPIGYRRDHIHPGKFVLDALARGYRMGFVGGSDSHGLRWHATEMEGRAEHIPAGTHVGWKEDAYRGGMTVVLAHELTREALFNALYHRRCYATSGEPIVLDFRVNGALMGSEIAAVRAPHITASVRGTGPIRSIDVVRSGHVFGGVQCTQGEGIQTLTLELDDTIIIPGETHYYYLRVLQEDGNMAWSSPIWIHQEGT